MRVKKNLIKYKDPTTGEYDPIPVVVSESAEEKFELIESFETTEELASFVRTAEPDGTPYDFQKLKVIIKQPKASKQGSAGVILYENASNINYYFSSSQAFDTKYCTFSQYNIKIDNGFLTGDTVTATAKNEDIDIDLYPQTHGYLGGTVHRNLFDICEVARMNKIEYLRYGSLNGYPIPVGTKIQIYAVRS